MTNFKFSFYHILNEKKQNPFEIIFNETRKQLEIYQRQFDLTLRTYKKEWDDELAKRDREFEQNKEKAEEIYNDSIKNNGGDEFAHQYAMNQSGLDYLFEEHSSDIEQINIEYNNFLDLYSKSILIAIYSLNESKLNEIAETAADVFTKKIKPLHFNSRDYLEASFQYLNLVIDLELDSLQKFLPKLKDLQYLRNKIIHNEAKFIELEQVSKIVKNHKSLLSLNERNQLKIKGSKFVRDLFELFSDFYQALFWLVDARQDSAILKNGFEYWLGILDREVAVEQLKITNTSTEKQIYLKVNFKNFAPSTLEFKITLKKGNFSFTYQDQTENDLIKDFIGHEGDIKGKNIYEIFESLMVTKNFQINIMIF